MFQKKKKKFQYNELQKKIFLTKLKGHPNLFVTSKFLYSQYRNKEENTQGIEDLFLYRRIIVKSVFVRTIFDCIRIENGGEIGIIQRARNQEKQGDSNPKKKMEPVPGNNGIYSNGKSPLR